MSEEKIAIQRAIADLKGFVNGEWSGTEGFLAIIEALEKVISERKESDFYEWLMENNYNCNNWFIGTEEPKDCYAFQQHVIEAYGNGSLTGIQGDFCCLVCLGPEQERSAIVTLGFLEETGEYFLEIQEMHE